MAKDFSCQSGDEISNFRSLLSLLSLFIFDQLILPSPPLPSNARPTFPPWYDCIEQRRFLKVSPTFRPSCSSKKSQSGPKGFGSVSCLSPCKQATWLFSFLIFIGIFSTGSDCEPLYLILSQMKHACCFCGLIWKVITKESRTGVVSRTQTVH